MSELHNTTVMDLAFIVHMRKGQMVRYENMECDEIKTFRYNGERIADDDPFGQRLIHSLLWNDKMMIVTLKEEA